MERKELNETLFTKAFETQHNASLWIVSHFNYEIYECNAPTRKSLYWVFYSPKCFYTKFMLNTLLSICFGV
ncbi:hypothetical protein [Leptospira noguchii]|uniref:hypothetical protein n=1 Tax=Leptospira noguchii TaxID=28182 RepID=UPI003B96D448